MQHLPDHYWNFSFALCQQFQLTTKHVGPSHQTPRNFSRLVGTRQHWTTFHAFAPLTNAGKWDKEECHKMHIRSTLKSDISSRRESPNGYKVRGLKRSFSQFHSTRIITLARTPKMSFPFIWKLRVNGWCRTALAVINIVSAKAKQKL